MPNHADTSIPIDLSIGIDLKQDLRSVIYWAINLILVALKGIW